MPVFPSQDGPLHLYYVHVFRQVLLHAPGIYTKAYRVRDYLPPYSTYYYGLLVLNSMMRLAKADEVFACICIIVLASSVRALLRAVHLREAWSSLLMLPVLLNWPLMMGFLSYLLAAGLGIFAIAAWCRLQETQRWRDRLILFGLVALIVLTHAEPWAVVVGFIWFELLCRVLLPRLSDLTSRRLRWSDCGTALAVSLPYLYLAHFRARVTRELDYVDYGARIRRVVVQPGLHERIQQQWDNLIHLLGLTVISGPGLSKLYLHGLQLLLFGSMVLAAWFLIRPTERVTYWQQVWGLFAILFGAALLLIPESLGGGYFFATRLQIVLFSACVVAASFGFESRRKLAQMSGGLAIAMLAVLLLLAVRHISPVARDVASIEDLPAVASTNEAGLIMRPAMHQQPPLIR